MDDLLYITITKAIYLTSLVGFIITVISFIIKKKIYPIGILLVLIFLVGMYLYIPAKLLSDGIINQNPKILQKAIKLSINPFEKRLCYKYMAQIYADDIYYQGIKDGNKAINYMEYALKGEYSKYKTETLLLAYWYSIKGDEKKTKELAAMLGSAKNIPLRNIYIMNDNYKEAVETFEIDEKSAENFLAADLYKKLKNLEAYKKSLEIAEKTYKNNLVDIKTRSKRLEYKDEVKRYRNVDSYKDWIKAQRVEFGFN